MRMRMMRQPLIKPDRHSQDAALVQRKRPKVPSSRLFVGLDECRMNRT